MPHPCDQTTAVLLREQSELLAAIGQIRSGRDIHQSHRGLCLLGVLVFNDDFWEKQKQGAR